MSEWKKKNREHIHCLSWIKYPVFFFLSLQLLLTMHVCAAFSSLTFILSHKDTFIWTHTNKAHKTRSGKFTFVNKFSHFLFQLNNNNNNPFAFYFFSILFVIDCIAMHKSMWNQYELLLGRVLVVKLSKNNKIDIEVFDENQKRNSKCVICIIHHHIMCPITKRL